MLTLLLGVDIRYAAGEALISVIATSSGAASAYVRDGIAVIFVVVSCRRWPSYCKVIR